MKIFFRHIISTLALLCSFTAANAQEVKIKINREDVYNRVEINKEENVLKAETEGWLSFYPAFKSLNQEYTHNELPAVLRPEVVRWQLLKINGQTPSQFDPAGTLPPYRYFTTSNQTWFEPSAGGTHKRGDVTFNFKIPATEYASNAFKAGKYYRNIIHNYTVNEFDPLTFNMIIEVEVGISYLVFEPIINIDIASLNAYRSSSVHLIGDLGFSRVANTVDFNLWVEADREIKFTSSRGGASRNIDISKILLGATNPKVATMPLKQDKQNYTPTNFNVITGNRNEFNLQLSALTSDFLTHFFLPGTYKFKMKQEIKNANGGEKESKETEVFITVPPLSEIVVPAIGGEVNFIFNTEQLYLEGQTKTMANQLRISNNESYELYVKADSPFFKKSGVQADIPANILQIGVVGGLPKVTLATTSQKIINQSPPILDRNLNVEYSISPSNSQSLATKEKDTYSINIIYSFIAL